jgi:hypothetical protein
MFYLANDKRPKWTMGLATSKDGKSWTKSSGKPVLDIGGPNDWDRGSLMGRNVLWLDGRFQVWYADHAADADGHVRIGYATSKPVTSDKGNP